MAWSDNILEEILSEMSTSDAAKDTINKKLKVNTSTGSFNKPLNLPNNVAPFLERNPEYSRFFNSGMHPDIPNNVTAVPENYTPYSKVSQIGLGEGYPIKPYYTPEMPVYRAFKDPNYTAFWEAPRSQLPFNLDEINLRPHSNYFGKTVDSTNSLVWKPSSSEVFKTVDAFPYVPGNAEYAVPYGAPPEPIPEPPTIKNTDKFKMGVNKTLHGFGPALGTLTGLAALDEAVNGKNPTALGMLMPSAAGMGLGSLFYSAPLNEGEDAMMTAINAGSNLPFQGSVAAATNGTDIGVADPNVAKQYADSIASSLNFENANLDKIISNDSNQNQPKQDRRLLNNAEGIFLYEKAMRDKKPPVKATKPETTSAEEPATSTTAKTTPNTTTTPTTTADTDIAIKTPVYDRPDYTKGKSLLGLDELAKAIMAGEFGNGANRRQRLMNAGYTPEEIANAQKLVNKTIAKPATRTNARTSTTRPTARRNVDSVIARPAVVNTPVQPVNTNYAPSGYAVGHEAYYDPIAGQLRFR